MPQELTYVSDVAIGSHGARARLAQEWLCLNGASVVIDGRFGPASAAATRAFQERSGLAASGVVDRATFDRLVAPMRRAVDPISPPADATLGAMVVAYARQHIAQSPREVGGQNMGPWVRLYMGGNQGAPWPWCAGFASFVLKQAAESIGSRLPLRPSFSCDLLAANARVSKCFCAGSPKLDRFRITPGSLFLNRRAGGDWDHVGIVISAGPEVFEGIEGNTNDSGDREGYEVCQRTRGYARKDFVLIA